MRRHRGALHGYFKTSTVHDDFAAIEATRNFEGKADSFDMSQPRRFLEQVKIYGMIEMPSNMSLHAVRS